MCDFFWQRTDAAAADQGDLADIVRASGVVPEPPAAAATTAGTDSWQQPAFAPLPPPQQQFGGRAPSPFAADPQLLRELAGGSCSVGGPDDRRMESSLFSRVLQISPGPAVRPPPLLPTAAADHGLQISSPRATGIKRRKSQAKKVVCIPAPAAASNRPSGEVVPSDLWAWRKYGQKPIKGSPYPRGYYRCSSSKGCSARKQVERSRTDPNMLVITYTSEHNHPWPTQRNALAGSTRSQPAKNGASSASKNSQRTSAAASVKEEPKDSSNFSAVVKEEVVGDVAEKSAAAAAEADEAFDRMFYNEINATGNQLQPDVDFFADLAELDPDPMSLIFARPGFDKSEEVDGNKALDSFMDMFDWGGSSFGDQQAKKGL